MYLIYKITNTINNKVYIGYTSGTIQHRWREHVNAAISCNSPYPFHKAIRKYGFNNFNIQQIEEVADKKSAMEREKYWIQYYRSYTKWNKGYNATLGGEDNPQLKGENSPVAKLTQKDVDNIRNDLLNTSLSYLEIIQKHKLTISDRHIASINSGESWRNENITYPIRKNTKSISKQGNKNPSSKLTQENVYAIIDLLKNSNIPQTEIAKQFKVSYNTINFINRCKTWSHLHNYKINIRKGE